MTETIDLNDTRTLRNDYKTTAGAPLNPDSVSFTLDKPDGSQVTYTTPTPTIDNTTVGTFKVGVLFDQAGPWRYTWTAIYGGAKQVDRGDIYVSSPLSLVVRTQTPDNKSVANTFFSLGDLDAVARGRMDSRVWQEADHDTRIRAIVQAYEDLIRCRWQAVGYGEPQSRITDFPGYEYNNELAEPPIWDPDFLAELVKAQTAQACYILAGTQVRDMAREGIILTRALQGAEMEIAGYRGAICAEVREILRDWIASTPRRRRMSLSS